MKKELLFKVIEVIVSVIIAAIAYFVGSNNLSEALVWFLFPLIICSIFKKEDFKKEIPISDEIENLACQLNNVNQLNTEIYELYCAELNNLLKKVESCFHNKLFEYSYTPDLRLYESVCLQLMNQFKGNKENDFFYATAKCDRETVEWFFDYDQISRIFLPKLNDKLQKGEIVKFYRLFIYKEDDLYDPLLWLLWLLHKESENALKNNGVDFQYKFINEEQFYNLTKAEPVTDEMGVWGNHCVFIQKGEQQESGYSFKEENVILYKSIFERIWSCAKKIKFDKMNTDSILEKNKENKLRKEIAGKLVAIKNKSDTAVLNDELDLRTASLNNITYIQSWIKSIEPLSISNNSSETKIF